MAEAPEQSNRTLTTLSKIEQFHSNGLFWDVQLQVDTKVFKCQRSILAANSEYFYTMFTSNFIESNTTRDQPIPLKELDSVAFEKLLHFFYTGDICVEDSNVLPLLFMNDFLRIHSGHVKEQCLVHVESRSQKEEPMLKALDLLCFTYLKKENVFVDTLRAHICHHLYYYSKDAQLMEISFEILKALLESSKDYIVPLRGSADVLLMIVHNWINHNREGRSQYLSNLIENIDFANVSFEFSRSLIERLENAVNEVANLSKNNVSVTESKMLAIGKAIDTKLTDCIGQFDAIISFNFKNVNDMQVNNATVFSSQCIISNLSWKIGIKRTIDDELGMFLYCDGADSTSVWNCYASAMFTIVSHKEGREDFVRKLIINLFTSDNLSGYGPRPFMKFDYLKDSENGYLNDDNSITLNVHVYADVPFRKMI